MQLLANAKQQFIDQNGAPLANGSVYFYAPGTTNPMPTYQDRAGTILNTNPVLLDSRGQAVIWGNGTYRQVLKDASGVTIWDQITEDTNEGLTGNITDNVFVAGTDFTPGTTASLTLTVSPGSLSNTWIYFDAAYQDDSQATLSGAVLTFSSPIPVGVQKVTVKIGTTVAIGTPNAGTVVDSSVSSGSALYNRITQMVSVTDPMYGAKGDGVTDDTAAIQNCISANAYVFFPPGKTFKTTATIAVPASCRRIDGTAAFMTGPGITGVVDGFSFTNFYQIAGEIPVKSELYILPSLKGYRYGVNLTNAAFLRIFSDTIENVVCGYFVSCNDSSSYCFENELEARFIWHARNSANTLGAAFYWQSTGTANAAFQGNRCKCFYTDDVFAGVYHEYTSTGDNGIFNNEYDLGELDQSDYAVYCKPGPHSSQQLYRIPIGITSPGNAQMFYQVSTSDTYQVGGLTFNDPSWTAFTNAQYNGTTNRPGIPIFTGPGGQPPTAHVSASGSDSTGDGSAAKPYATIQKAVNVFSGLDLFGQTAIVSVSDGTYSAGALYNSFGGSGANGSIAIVGNSVAPANVVINCIGAIAFSANGSGAQVTISGMTVNGGVLAQNYGVLNVGPSVVFGNNTGGVHMQAMTSGQVNITSNYSMTGQCQMHLVATLNGVIQNAGASTVSVSGTLPLNTFAQASQGGQISVPGLTYSVSGSTTGVRYSAALNGTIWTNGGGASFFPGNSAGATSTGGQYA